MAVADREGFHSWQGLSVGSGSSARRAHAVEVEIITSLRAEQRKAASAAAVRVERAKIDKLTISN